MQGFGELDELYQDIILDHYRSPRKTQPLADADVQVEENNPFCGDEVTLQIKAPDSAVDGISVIGRGCSISKSSGSLMGQMIDGMSIAEVRELLALFKGMMKGEELSEQDLDRLEDLGALQGVRKYPVRIKCALLAWSALEDALRQLERR